MKETTTVETINANPLYVGSYASGIELNAIKYVAGGRYWLATVIPYQVLGQFVTTTSVKKKSEAISQEVVNRFLDAKHVKEIKNYILANKDNFTIPPITLVAKTDLPFKPNTYGPEQFKTQDDVINALNEVGSLLGRVVLPLGYRFTCLDGNHRSKALAELAIENPEFMNNNNMLCNIVYETDNMRIRQDFVDINKNAKTTTATINTLFNTRDPLSKLTAQVVDDIEYLAESVELLGASISKSSKKLYTLNNIKNAIVELGTHNCQSATSISSLSAKLKDQNLLDNLALEVDVFFDLLKQNSIIAEYLQTEDRVKKIEAREKGLISTGVGLIIASRVVSEAAENTESIAYEEIVKKVMRFDWSRNNPFFKGRILSENQKIISNVTSLKETSDAILNELFPEAYAKKIAKTQ